MRLKTTLFLFITFFYFSQVEAQSCNGADFQTVDGVAVLELTEKVPSGYRNEAVSGATGGRAVTYRGSNNFRRPGNVTTYKLRVNTTGTYRVQWLNKISIIATNGAAPNTEHNDSWLKINGSDFYGQRGSSRVYPNGSGKSPIAKGDSANGFMKIFTNSVNWSWVTKTNDGGGHDIFVTFNQTGVYDVQIGGRSDGHTIDRIVLYRSGVSTSSATSTSRAQTTCSGGGTPTPTPPTPTPPTPTPPTPSQNAAPTVSITSPSGGQSVNAGGNVTINLSANDSDGNIVKHEIFVNNTKVDTDGTSYTPHIIRNIAAGNYSIRATVTDNGGKTASSTVNISVGGGTTPPPTPPSVSNAAPTVRFTNLSNGNQVSPGSTVSVGVAANDSDGSIVKYQVFVNGLLVDTDGSNYTPHPIRNIAAGSYEIKVTVTDNQGATASSTVNITAGTGSTPPNSSSAISFNLINASTNSVIGALVDGATLSSSKTQNVNIRVNLPSGSKRLGIEVFRNGTKIRSAFEFFWPYSVYGDTSGNYNGVTLQNGSYRLVAGAYSSTSDLNSVIARTEIEFTVGSASGKSAVLFPNPVQTDGKVSVRLPEGAAGSYEYSVSNALGVQVDSGTFDASSSQRDVQLSLPNVGRQVQGVYYMTLSANGSRETIPLIRE